jgi:hypothetical protein
MTRRFIAGAALVLAAAAALAQVTSPEPVLNFQLPVFNKKGYRVWELRGGSGRYVDKNHIELSSVRLDVYSGDEAETLLWSISTPLAIAAPEDRVVSGPSQIHVVGRQVELFGDDWIYEDARKTVVIHKGVVATFTGSIGSILQ